jgi:ABC-2 type transport system ATP-binding protein
VAQSQEAAAGGTPPAAIRTELLERRYGRHVALRGLSLAVPRGSVFGFLGPNGAGKTTAVKLLLGLVRPTGGEGMVLGLPLGEPAARRRIGYLPELFRYQEWLSGREVLEAHAALAGMQRGRRRAAAEEALATVGLSGEGLRRVGAYSKGMQQRLGLAVALLGDPELVVLDEPTSALDPVGRHDVRTIIQDLRAKGTTVFLNSHLLTEIEAVCDEVAVLDHGRVIAQGGLGSLLQAKGVDVEVEGVSQEEIGRLGGTWSAPRNASFPELAEGDVPELVARLVALGGRIHGVTRRRASLEQRFLDWLEVR